MTDQRRAAFSSPIVYEDRIFSRHRVGPVRATAHVYQRPNREIDEMYAANWTTIRTYGIKTLRLDLGLRRVWKFIIADVAKPIIGADLLNHFGPLVDLRQLLDTTTSLISTGRIAAGEPDSVRTIVSGLTVPSTPR